MSPQLLQRFLSSFDGPGLHESLFFNPRMAIVGSWEGRTCLNSLLERWANILIQLLQVDPLKAPALEFSWMLSDMCQKINKLHRPFRAGMICR